MTTDRKPAVLFLRMSPQLRQALRQAADSAGCSLNAFAVQVLATAAGDPAGFRAPVDENVAPIEIERDALGFPLHWKARIEHSGARNMFMVETERELGAHEMFKLAKHYDAEDPGYYVEWRRSRRRDAE